MCSTHYSWSVICVARSFVLDIRMYSSECAISMIVYYLCMDIGLPKMSSSVLDWWFWTWILIFMAGPWLYFLIVDASMWSLGYSLWCGTAVLCLLILLCLKGTFSLFGTEIISAYCIWLDFSSFTANVCFGMIALWFHQLFAVFAVFAVICWSFLVWFQLQDCVHFDVYFEFLFLAARRSQDHVFAFIVLFADNRKLLLWHIHLWCSAEYIVCNFSRKIPHNKGLETLKKLSH